MNTSSLVVAAAFVAGAFAGGLTAVSCDVDAPSDDQALTAALAATAGRTEGRGPTARPLEGADDHRLLVEAEIALEFEEGARRLVFERVVDRRAGGRGVGDEGAAPFRVVDRRTLHTAGAPTPRYDEGREGVFDGARFATRRRFGPWIEHDLLERGHERLLHEAHGLGEQIVAGFSDYLNWEEDPAADEVIAGIPVRWAEARLDARVAPRPLDAEALAALRDHEEHWPAWVAATHRPDRVTGRVARARRGGELVAARLEIRGRATVDGVSSPFAVTLEQRVEALPSKASLELPADVLPATRERSWRMIESVLGDSLAPIYVRR